MSEAPPLELIDVGVVREGQWLLRDVTWTVGPGERWIVLGANGSGKTTLLRIASLYLHPSTGVVRVLGGELGRIDVRRQRTRIGLASPAFGALLRPELTPVEVVMTAANGALDVDLLRTGGDCVVYGSGAAQFMLPFFPLIVKNLTVRFFIVFNLDADDRRRAVATLTEFLRDGALVHNIAERVPLADIARAHELLESGRSVGNVLLAIP